MNDTQKKFFKKSQDIARLNEGRLLSKTYRSQKEKLEFECKFKHKFKLNLKSILESDRWCYICTPVRKKRTIEDMQAIAAENGGECLSKEYKYYPSKLTFKCEKNHVWDANPSWVKNNWCPLCKKKYTIDYIQKKAAEFNGRCLSKEYLGMQKPLLFECEKKHQFEFRPTYIFNFGHWCPTCRKEKGKS